MDILTPPEQAAGGHAVRPAPTPPDFDVPPGATDCHVHTFPDPDRFPLSPNRLYTPRLASAEDLLTFQRQTRMDRVVVVSASVYGVDNSAAAHTIRTVGPDRARGVAMIDETTSDADVDALHAQGFRGVRVLVGLTADTDLAPVRKRFDLAVRRLTGRPWHIQLYSILPLLIAMREDLERTELPLVLDHYAGVRAAQGLDQPGIAELLAWLRAGKVYVKLSGAGYSASAPDFSDLIPVLKAMVEANPDQLIWGTDWPHPGNAHAGGQGSAHAEVDDGRMLNQFAAWIGDAAILRKILVDNPARLYGF